MTEKEILAREADWLETAHRNSANYGFSAELREGFRLAAGWVRWHSEHPEVFRDRSH